MKEQNKKKKKHNDRKHEKRNNRESIRKHKSEHYEDEDEYYVDDDDDDEEENDKRREKRSKRKDSEKNKERKKEKKKSHINEEKYKDRNMNRRDTFMYKSDSKFSYNKDFDNNIQDTNLFSSEFDEELNEYRHEKFNKHTNMKEKRKSKKDNKSNSRKGNKTKGHEHLSNMNEEDEIENEIKDDNFELSDENYNDNKKKIYFNENKLYNLDDSSSNDIMNSMNKRNSLEKEFLSSNKSLNLLVHISEIINVSFNLKNNVNIFITIKSIDNKIYLKKKTKNKSIQNCSINISELFDFSFNYNKKLYLIIDIIDSIDGTYYYNSIINLNKILLRKNKYFLPTIFTLTPKNEKAKLEQGLLYNENSTNANRYQQVPSNYIILPSNGFTNMKNMNQVSNEQVKNGVYNNKQILTPNPFFGFKKNYNNPNLNNQNMNNFNFSSRNVNSYPNLNNFNFTSRNMNNHNLNNFKNGYLSPNLNNINYGTRNMRVTPFNSPGLNMGRPYMFTPRQYPQMNNVNMNVNGMGI